MAVFAVLTLALKACADLTTAPFTGNVSIIWSDSANATLPPSTPGSVGPPRVYTSIRLPVGSQHALKFRVAIGTLVQSDARYSFSILSNQGVIERRRNGDSIFVVKPGVDTIVATLVGATVGTPAPGAKLADTVEVRAEADENFLEGSESTINFTFINQADTLDAEARDVNGTKIEGTEIVWQSLDENIVRVDTGGTLGGDGILRAVNNGTTRVRVTFAGGVTDSVFVTVQQETKRFRLSTPINEFNALNAQATVTAVPEDSGGVALRAGALPPPAFTFFSSVGGVNIDAATGVMRALANTQVGVPASIFARVGGQNRSDALPIVVRQVARTLTIGHPTNSTLASVGAKFENVGVLALDSLGSEVPEENITWTSSDPGVATVEGRKLATITARAIGTATITAKADQASQTIVITVTNDPNAIELSPDPFQLKSLTETKTLSARITNTAGDVLSGNRTDWVSRNPGVATITPPTDTAATEVTVTAVSKGKAWLVITSKGKADSVEADVTNQPSAIDILPASLSIPSIGGQILSGDSRYGVVFQNELGAALTRGSVSWSSSNTGVIQITDTLGSMQAVGTGFAYVIAFNPLAPNRRDSVHVTVTNVPSAVTVSTTSPTTLTAFGQTAALTATVRNDANQIITNPADAPVSWSVASGSSVTVDAVTGVVTAVGNGASTVRATSGAAFGDLTITVTQIVSNTRSLIIPEATSVVADGSTSTKVRIRLRDANDSAFVRTGPGALTVNPTLATTLGTISPPADSGGGLWVGFATAPIAAGTASITGTVNALTIGNPGAITYTAAPAAKYIVTTNSTNPTVGGLVTITAQLADANNNAVLTAGQTVTWSSTGGGSFGAPTSSTNASGVATVTFTVSSAVGTTHVVTATTGGNTGSSPSITPIAGAATQYLVTAASTSPAAGAGVVISAQLADASGNAVATANQTVTWSKSNGNGSFSAATSLTNGAGIATITLNTHTVAGTATTVTATTGGITGTTAGNITTVAGGSSQITVTTAPSANPQSGIAFPTQPVLQLRDGNGNVVNAANISVTATTSGGTLGGTTTVQTNASGVATFTNLSLAGGTGARTLTFSASGLTSATANVTVIAGAAASMVGSGSTSGTVGQTVASPPSVTVTDASGNPVPGVNVTFTLTATGGAGGAINPASPAVVATNASGVATLTSWTLGTTAGSNNNTVTAAATGVTTVTFNASGAPGTATTIAAASATSQSTTVFTSVAAPPSVTVTDAGGNPVANFAVTFALTAPGGTGGAISTPATVNTNSSGVATLAFWTLGQTAGTNNNTVTATGTGLSTITFNASGTFGAAASIVSNSATSQSAAVNSAATAPSVLVRDSYGNAVSGVAVTFTVMAGGGTLATPASGGSINTGTNGIATVGTWTLGSAAGTNTVDATVAGATLVGEPVTFNATGTPGAANNVVTNSTTSQSAIVNTAVATPPSVIVRDQFNNPVGAGISVTFSVTAGGGLVNGGSTANVNTNASGVATLTSWSLGASNGTNTVQVTVGNTVSFNATGTAGTPTQISVNGTPSTSATVNTNVATPPSVLIQDASNNPVSGFPVTFTVTQTGGTGGTINSGSPAVVLTNASGIASLTTWTLGQTAGTNNNTVTATGSGLSSITFNASGTPGAANNLIANSVTSQSAVISTTVAAPPSVIVRDQFNNALGAGTNVTFTLTGVGGGGTAAIDPASVATVATNSSGVATLTSWTLGTAAGTNNNTVTATISGLNTITFNASGTAGAAANIVSFGTPSTSATVGTAVATPPSVRITDASGNPVSGFSVSFTLTQTGGTGGAIAPVTPASVTTNTNGVATLTGWTLGQTAGTNNNEVQATGSGLSTVTFQASGTAGTATNIIVNGSPSTSGTAGSAVATPPSVLVRDAFNNPVNGVVVTFTVTAGSGSTSPASGGTVTTGTNGVASLTSWTLGNTTGTNTVEATVAALTLTGEPVQFNATGNAGAATNIVITQSPSASPQSGIAFPTQPIVQLRDANGNNVPQAGVNVEVVIQSGGGTLGGTQTIATNSSGQAVFTNLSLSGLVGARTLRFGSPTVGATTLGTVDASVTLTPGAPSQLFIQQQPSANTTVGSVFAQQPIVQVRDAAGNVVTGANSTVVAAARSAGTGALQGTTVVTSQSGVATFTNLSHNTDGTITIEFTAAGLTAATSSNVVVAGGTQYLVTPASSSVAAGQIVVISAQLADAGNNPVAQAGKTVVWSKTGTGGSFATPTSLTDANGIASVAFTVHSLAGTVHTVTATDNTALTGVTGNITVVAGAPSVLVFVAQPPSSVAAGATFGATVEVRDGFANPILADPTGSNETVTLALTSAGGAALGGTVTQSVNWATGRATFTGLSIDQIANYTLTASDANFAANLTDATSNSIAVTTTASLALTSHGAEAGGPVNAVFTVTLGAVNNTGSAIDFDIDDLLTGTAASGTDYTAVAGAAKISVANGSATGTFSVVVTDDALLENTETVNVEISNPSSSLVTSIGTATATANITSNDTATADLSVQTQGNEAGPVNIVYRVTLSRVNNTGANITVNLADSTATAPAGSATAGSDYTAFGATNTVTIPNGQSTADFTVTVLNDALLENTETVKAKIDSPNHAQVSVGTGLATANILEEGATATLAVQTHGAEASGTTDIVYRVTLSKTNATGGAVTFNIADSTATAPAGTATAGSDYTAFGGTNSISVANGQTTSASTGDFTVDVLDDVLLEGTETVKAKLNSPSHASVTFGTALATANIVSDDNATANLSVQTNGAESGTPTNVVFRITLSTPNNTGADITFNLADSTAVAPVGTATAGSDYTAFGGTNTVTIPDGASFADFTVTVLDDALLENTETVKAKINSPSNGAVTLGTALATANITSDDLATADLDVQTHGNEAGPVNVVYRVTLSRVNNTGANITFNLADSTAVAPLGTATAGSDYTAFGGTNTISVAPGASTGTFAVTVVNDALLENTETVKAKIDSPNHAQVSIGTGLATANILEEGATATLAVQTQGAEASGTTDIVYRVSLNKTNATGGTITFNLADSTATAPAGTATAGTDYTAFGGTNSISIADGQSTSSSTGDFTVDVLNDLDLETTETVKAKLNSPSHASVTLGTVLATANIVEEGALANLDVQTNGDEATGTTDVEFRVTLRNPGNTQNKTNRTGANVTFNIADSTGIAPLGTATAGADYTAFGGTNSIVVANNAATGTFTVDVLDDALLENTETVKAKLDSPSPSSVTLGTALATANITTDDLATASLSVQTNGNESGPVNIVYRVTLSRVNNTGANITVNLADSTATAPAGSATAGSDYTAFGGTNVVTIPNGQSTGDFTVTVIDDADLENTETVKAAIDGPSHAQVSVGTNLATANLLEAGAVAHLAVQTQGAEASGTTDIVYRATLRNAANSVTKTNRTGGNVTFNVGDSTAVAPAGTATGGTDYTAFNGGTLTIANNASTGDFTVDVLNDLDLENDETVKAKLDAPSPSSVTLGTVLATANIVEEGAVAHLAVQTQGAEASGTTDIVVRATLRNPGNTQNKTNRTGSGVTFNVGDSTAVAPLGTATAGTDYTAFNGGTLTIANNAATGDFTVDVLNDLDLENDETVKAKLDAPSPSSVTLGTVLATANIVEEGAVAHLAVQTQGAEASGTTDVIFRATLRNPGNTQDKTNRTGSGVTFNVGDSTAVAPLGTATAGTDYTAFNGGTLTIANNAATGDFTVDVLNDADLENDETVKAKLDGPSPSSVTLGTVLGTANIVEEGAVAHLAVQTQGAEASGTTDIVFRVTLRNPGNTVTKTNRTGSNVAFNIADSTAVAPLGTATAGTDYTAFGATNALTIANNASTADFTVDVLNDLDLENDETVKAKLDSPSPSSVTLGTALATANIVEEGAIVNLAVQTNGAESGTPTDVVYRATLRNPGDTQNKTNRTGGNVTFSVGDSTAVAPAGTATAGSDYTAFNGGTLNITNNSATGDFTVTVLDDALLESTETVKAKLDAPSPSSVTLGTVLATANITSEDVATATLAVQTQGDEDNGGSGQNIVYRVTLSRVNNTNAAITFNLADSTAIAPVGSATSGSDYTAFGGTITVPIGQSTGDFTVTVIDDADLENTETVKAAIDNSSNAQVSVAGAGGNLATANITEAGAVAHLAVQTQGAEASGTTDIVFRATLRNAANTVTKTNRTGSNVTFNVGDSTAVAPAGTATVTDDYTAFNGGTLTIANNASTGDVTVDVLNDLDLENDETVKAKLDSPSPASVTLGTVLATATIVEEGAVGHLAVQTQGAEASGTTDIVYRVTLRNPGNTQDKTNRTGSSVTFNIADSTATAPAGTATAGDDYTVFGGTNSIAIANNQANSSSTGDFTVDVLNDLDLENTETVKAKLNSPSLASVTLGAAALATANIVEEGAVAHLAVQTQGAEASGTTDIVFRATLRNPGNTQDKTNRTGGNVTFNVGDSTAIAPLGTATVGDDYTTFNGGTLNIANNSATGDFTVDVVNDLDLENTETVKAKLDGPSPATVTLGTVLATANIVEEGAVAHLAVQTQGAEASGTTDIVFRATLRNPGNTQDKTNRTGSNVTFNIADSTATAPAGTAAAGDDYTPFGGTNALTIANNAATGDFTVDVLNDALLELTETVKAKLDSPSPATVTLGTALATANIVEEGATASLSVQQQGDETGPQHVLFRVTLSKQNATGSAVMFNIADSTATAPAGTATAGDDYTGFGGTNSISVANGQTHSGSTGDFQVDVLNDALLESTETVKAKLNSPSLGTVTFGTALATANITSEDVATAALAVQTQGDEDNGGSVQNVVYRVTLSKVNNTNAAITFNLADSTAIAPAGSATSGSDYTAFGGTITVPIGQSTGDFTVTVIDDNDLENTETVKAAIDNSSNAQVTVTSPDNLATANITEAGAVAHLAVQTQGAEASGTTDIVFRATLRNAANTQTKTNRTGGNVTFNVGDSTAIAPVGTATVGDDYTAFNGGTLTIANNASTGDVTVDVLNDADLENTETVKAKLDSPSPATVTLGTVLATANIVEEGAVGHLAVQTQGAEASGTADIVYRVTLRNPGDTQDKTNRTGSSVTFNIADSTATAPAGTATAGDDYTIFGGTNSIAIANNQANSSSTGDFTVDVLNDLDLENTETVKAKLNSPSNASVTLGSAALATANIVEEGAVAHLAVQTQGAEASGTTDIVFRATLRNPGNTQDKTNRTGSGVTFNVGDSTAVAPLGTATVGDDYTAFNGGTLTIANNAVTGDFTVDVVNDLDLESTETVKAKLDSPSPATVTLGTVLATANIVEEGAVAHLAVQTQGAEASGTTDIVFRATLRNPGNTQNKANRTGGNVTFNVGDSTAIAPVGTATVDDDYTTFNGGTLTITNNSATGDFTVDVLNDALLELTETVKAKLDTPNPSSIVSLGTVLATANIVEEGATATLSVQQQGDETGPQHILFRVTLSKQNATGSAVTFNIADSTAVAPLGTATAGADYTGFGGTNTISVANGQTHSGSTGDFQVDVLNDVLLESTETVKAKLNSPNVGTVTFGTALATANITSEDVATAALAVQTQGDEDNGGSVQNIVYRVTLSKVNNTNAAITFNLADSTAIAPVGSATSGSDYTAFGGTITVPIGQSTGDFTVTVIDDADLENTETVKAAIDNSSNAQVTVTSPDNLATANITEAGAVLNIASTQQGDESLPTNIQFTVTLRNAANTVTKTNRTGSDVTFDVIDSTGTSDPTPDANASVGSDYVAFAANGVTIGNNQSAAIITVTVNDAGGVAEGTERVFAYIQNASPGNVTVGTALAFATIDDDGVGATEDNSANMASASTDAGDQEDGETGLARRVVSAILNDRRSRLAA